MITCQIAQTCPGCTLWGKDYKTQSEEKIQHLKNLFLDAIKSPVSFHSAGEFGLRERFDFIIKNQKIGLINKNRELIPIEKCLQLTPDLQKAFDIIAKINFDIKIGTLRLRQSSLNPTRWGLWLDFANNDIKKLLIEKNILIELSKSFFIEIGQKKKTLDPNTFNLEQIKLQDPVPQHWFHTYGVSNQIIPLNCAVSGFTQPSAKTAKLITDLIIKWLQSPPHEIWEFGSGIGQYTLPILSLNHYVTVFENDLFALNCLEKTVKENSLDKNLRIETGDFQNKTPVLNTKPKTILVNPPKSGLKKFVETIIHISPEKIIYISCYPETLKQDAQKFLENNYKIIDTHIIDQFPQTNHYEVAMLFQRINI